MAAVVFFHAHPDDEAMSTGGTMAKLARAGHRPVLVVATNGEHGEVPEDLAPGETLPDRRAAELQRSAEVLGIARIASLGYRDSGMAGWPQNHEPDAFARIPVDVAAEKLAEILVAERPVALVTYDAHGGYGHPDHIQVHRVGHRAAELAGVPTVYESSINRDEVRRLMALAIEAGVGGVDLDFDPDDPSQPFGLPQSELTTAIDVREFLGAKRAAIAEHRSQVTDTSFFLGMPEEAFAAAFSTEWYVRIGAPRGEIETTFAGLI